MGRIPLDVSSLISACRFVSLSIDGTWSHPASHNQERERKPSPIHDVWRLPDPQRPTGIDQGRGGIVMSGSDDHFLMELGRARLDARNEPSADPYRLGAPHEVRGEPPAVVHGAGADDVHWLTCKRRCVSLDGVDARRDEDRSRHVTSVAATFAGLRTDDVGARCERLGDVLRVADHLQPVVEQPGSKKEDLVHIHDRDPGLVQFVNDVFGRDSNGADEELDFLFDDDVDQLRQLSLCIVVLERRRR